MPEQKSTSSGAIPFALIYFTFFLDNVLLTVLVPIIPDWLHGESLALWSRRDVPLAALLNTTMADIAPDNEGVGGSQAVVGLVLGAKAAAQLVTAPLAATAVCRRGPAAGLSLATALLAAAALVFVACSGRQRAWAACCVGAGRALHGAGSALAAVAGLALLAAAVPGASQPRAVGALLGAVALGVLVGYPFGGVSYALWTRSAPFLLIAAALMVNLAMQYTFLNEEEYNLPSPAGACSFSASGLRRAPAAACAGAVLLTTSVMAALEPCLPMWIINKFHTQTGLVFIPDSVGYLVAASTLGGVARAVGAERVALAGQLAVGVGALCVPLAAAAWQLAAPHAALGAGLGAADAALLPALMQRHKHHLPHLAALLQAASSAAYAIGPIVGGVTSWLVGFETTMRALGVANLLYAAYLYRTLTLHPLSEQWGASTSECTSAEPSPDAERTPLRPMHYTAMR